MHMRWAPTPTSPAPTPTPGLAECTNDDVGYTVNYPDDWHTNPGDVVEACTYFDPEPISVAAGTEPDVAITISAEPVDFETASSPDPFGHVHSRDSAMLDGREAAAILDEATGDAMLEDGTLSYVWVIDLADDDSLIASTHDAEGREFRSHMAALDQIMASISFTATLPEDDDADSDPESDIDAERTVIAEYEGFDVVATHAADETCLFARAAGTEGERTCWNEDVTASGLTVDSLDVPGDTEAIAGLAAPRLPRVLVGTSDEGTVGFRTSDVTGAEVRAWAVPVAQSATERVIGYTGDERMDVILDAQGDPTDVLGDVSAQPESTEPSDDFGLLTEVETGLHAGFDRVAFRFRDDAPGYRTSYEERPITQAGSGHEVEVDGDGVVVIHKELASGRERVGEGELTYTGPERFRGAGTFAINELVRTGDYEGVLSWAIGVSDELPFRVQVFGDVLVVDVRHPET